VAGSILALPAILHIDPLQEWREKSQFSEAISDDGQGAKGLIHTQHQGCTDNSGCQNPFAVILEIMTELLYNKQDTRSVTVSFLLLHTMHAVSCRLT